MDEGTAGVPVRVVKEVTTESVGDTFVGTSNSGSVNNSDPEKGGRTEAIPG